MLSSGGRRLPPLVVLLFADFLLLGLTFGAQGVLWAELVVRLQLSMGTFGAAQLVTPVVAVSLLLLGGPLSARAGNKRLAIASLLLMSGGSLALAGTTNLWTLVGALAVLGGGYGLFETAMNGAALDWEHATARHVLNVLHAGYSAGAVVGAIGTGVLVELGWPPAGVLTLVGGLCALGAAATLPVRYPLGSRLLAGSPEAGSLRAGAPSAGAPGTAGALTLFRRHRALALLALVCMLGSVGESAANLWSVIYLYEQGAGAVLGGAAFALTNAAMLIGRVANAPLVNRFGTRASLRVSGVG
ncbi:MAG: MFS transporter, partial [Chloroflexota bacterium]|nr:MFS transporter [Chloroflexota bacterium]